MSNRYTAANQEWLLKFPFSAQRQCEESLGSGWYALIGMVTPKSLLEEDLKDPLKILSAVSEVRVGVLGEMLRVGSTNANGEQMTKEQLDEVMDEMGVGGVLPLVIGAITPDEQARPKQVPGKKPQAAKPQKKR